MILHPTGVPEIDVSEINLLDFDRFAAGGVPHEWFTYLRKHAPIAHHPEPDGPGFYVFSRHDDVVAIGRDPSRFSSDARVGPITQLDEPTPEVLELMSVGADGQNMIT